MISLTLNVGSIITDLQATAGRAKDLTPAMKAIASMLVDSSKLRFVQQKGPDGEAWKQSRRATESSAKRQAKGKSASLTTLRDTGRLMNSLTGTTGDSIRTVTPESVIFGTNVPYATTMQFGAKKGQFGTKEVTVKEHFRRLKKVKRGGFKEAHVMSHTRKMIMPWGKIDARPFLGISQSDEMQIKSILEKHILGGKR
jgi:phage gpG-like protein